MPVVLNNTPLDPGCNTYVSATEMSDYIATHAVDASALTIWSALSVDDQAKWLINATRSLDMAATWIGNQYSRDQKLKWPRFNAWVEGYLLDVTTFPDRVKQATCEQALWLASLASQGEGISQQNQESFERIWVGPLKINVNDNTGNPPNQYFSDTVVYLLSDLAQLSQPAQPGGMSGKSVRLVRA